MKRRAWLELKLRDRHPWLLRLRRGAAALAIAVLLALPSLTFAQGGRPGKPRIDPEPTRIEPRPDEPVRDHQALERLGRLTPNTTFTIEGLKKRDGVYVRREGDTIIVSTPGKIGLDEVRTRVDSLELRSDSIFEVTRLVRGSVVLPGVKPRRHRVREMPDEIVLDHSMFNDNGTLPVEPPQVARLSVLFEHAAFPIQISPLTSPRGPPTYVFSIGEGLYAHVRSGSSPSPSIESRLSRQPLRRADLALIDLTGNSATTRAIEEAGMQDLSVQGPFGEVARVEEAIQGLSGRFILVIGHHEDGAFVRRDSHHLERMRIPIAQLSEAAERAGATLFLLGCKTATVGELGTMNTVNSVEVVQTLRLASDALNYLEFLQSLASGSMKLVVPETITSISETSDAKTPANGVKDRMSRIELVPIRKGDGSATPMSGHMSLMVPTQWLVKQPDPFPWWGILTLCGWFLFLIVIAIGGDDHAAGDQPSLKPGASSGRR